jgi:putative hydrolase of the HAD superfamily
MKPVLIFDLDDTLYLRSKPYISAAKKFLHELQISFKDFSALFKSSRPIGEEEYLRRIRGEISEREMKMVRTRRSFSALGISLTAEQALHFEDLYAKEGEKQSLLPEIQTFLNRAKENGYFLGIITNGSAARQWKKYQNLTLSRWFPADHVLVSDEIGTDKPHTRLYRIAEDRWKLEPYNLWYIGDSYETDILGAKKAGWHAVWIPQEYTKIPPKSRMPFQPDLLLPSVSDLIPYLPSES